MYRGATRMAFRFGANHKHDQPTLRLYTDSNAPLLSATLGIYAKAFLCTKLARLSYSLFNLYC
jgi:hypothetical protein